MTGLLAVISGCYVLVLRLLRSVFVRMVDDGPLPPVETFHPTVTILVPFRNEAEALPELIDALRRLNYPRDLLEVMLIDDHSEDDSVALARSSGFRLVSLPEGCTGKKQALDFGIQLSKSELIITTDADCRPEPEWVRAMVSVFADEQVQMVLGPVRLQATTWFRRWQAMEFSVLQTVTAVTADSGFPVMANGANLAYRRSLYAAVGGYADNFHIASGDDHFLLRKVAEKFPDSFRYAATSAAMVTTFPADSFRAFISQRIRWASKWKEDWHLPGSLAAPAVVAFQFCSWLILPYALWTGAWWWSLLWVARCYADLGLIRSAGRFYLYPVRWLDFFLLELILPVYMLFTAFASMFWRGSWKGRPLI